MANQLQFSVAFNTVEERRSYFVIYSKSNAPFLRFVTSKGELLCSSNK